MRPRVVFRSHYQVDEPFYLFLLITRCTSPIQSTYREVAAQRLSRELKAHGKLFNIAAAAYAIDLCQDLELITENNTWTPKGLLLSLFSDGAKSNELEDQLSLSLGQKLATLRVFLEADGAAMLFLAKQLAERRALNASENGWNDLAREMFTDVFRDYLSITNNTKDRVQLRREADRIEASGYSGNSGKHKILVHLQTMYRLEMVLRSNESGSTSYILPANSSNSPIEILRNCIPSVNALEKVISENQCLETAAKIIGIAEKQLIASFSHAKIAALHGDFQSCYDKIMATGIPLCPISTLLESVQVTNILRKKVLFAYSELLEILQAEQKVLHSKIRFHVDRFGKVAFIRISDNPWK